MTSKVKGSIPAIVRNDANVYEGDLIAYFRILWLYAQNLSSPYHNFRHVMHVLWLCHQACEYYGSELTFRQKRNLLIAAMFHDFNHTGKKGSDSVNIQAAILALSIHSQPVDADYFEEIRSLIAVTEYPYRVPSEGLSLSARIIRDADMGQSLSTAWIQQVTFGLAAEWGVTPLEVLHRQVDFHKKLGFHTAWGQATFPESDVQAKVDEVRELLELLAIEPAVTQ